MARLPVIQPGGQIPSTTAQPSVSGESMAAPYRTVAAAALKFADVAADWAERERKLRDHVDVTDAIGEATQKLDDYRTNVLDKDPDYRSKTEKFRTFAEDLRKTTLEKLSYSAGPIFNARYQSLAGTAEIGVRHGARQDEVQDGRIKTQTTINDLLTRASTARTPQEEQALIDQARQVGQDAVGASVYSAGQFNQVFTEAMGRFRYGQVQRLIGENPQAARAALDDPNNFKELEAGQRELLKRQADDRIEGRAREGRIENRVRAGEFQQSIVQQIRPENAEQEIAEVEKTDPALAGRMKRALRAYDSAEDFARQPLMQQRTILERYAAKESSKGLTTEERLTFRSMLQSHRQFIDDLNKDPYTAVLKRDTSLQDLAQQIAADPSKASTMREAAIESQIASGVHPGNVGVVSDPDVKKIVEDLGGLQGQQLTEALNMLRQTYGIHWDVLRRQLEKEGRISGKVPGLQTVLELPQTVDGYAGAAIVSRAARIKDDDLGKLLPKADVKPLQDSVNNALKDFRASLAFNQRGTDIAQRYYSDVLKVAVVMKQDTPDLTNDQAVRRAYNLVVGLHNTFTVDNGQTVRIPKNVSAGGTLLPVTSETVVQNMQKQRRDLGSLPLIVPKSHALEATTDDTRQRYIERVQQYGRWVPNTRGDGLVLVVEAAGGPQGVIYIGEGGRGQNVEVKFAQPALPGPKVEPIFPTQGEGAASLEGPTPAGPQGEGTPGLQPTAPPGVAPGVAPVKGFQSGGAGYDYETARRYGLKEDQNKKWPSRVELPAGEARALGLPAGSGVILKGRRHESWDKTVEGEDAEGFRIIRYRGRYYSIPEHEPLPEGAREAER